MNLLKAINYLSITITVVLTILFFVNLLGNPLYSNDSRFLNMIPFLITQPILVIFSLIISIKANQQKGILIFALFLSLISQNWVMQSLQMMNLYWIPGVLLVISSALTGTVYIKSFQCFPRQISKQDIKSVFPKNKIISGYINLAAKDISWFIFTVVIAGATLINISSNLIDIFILITALLSLYVNFKKSSSYERDKILWLFWGVIAFTFLSIIQSLLYYFTQENSHTIKLIFNALANFVLVFALLMSLFFSNAFDTGILIRRTLVDGFIFILIVLIYNTIEHYFLHWLAHELELSDAMLSSLLSGIFVLAFSPLHHKFMNFIEKIVKKKSLEHT